MANEKLIEWDLRCGNSVYKSVNKQSLKKWIAEGRIKEGETLVWRSGMSGWRKPEELNEFRSFFKKKKLGTK